MQLIDHRFWIGIILVEDELTFAIPPEPILHDVVDGDVQVAILASNAEDFILRLVTILALPEAVSPLAEHGSLPGEVAIAGDDLVEVRTVEEVVVDDVGDFRADVKIVGEAIVEAAARSVVPENAVALARQHQRHGDIAVVLRNVDRLTAIVPHAGLVLAQAIERLRASRRC